MRGSVRRLGRALALLVAASLVADAAFSEGSGEFVVIGERLVIQSKILDEERALLISTPRGYSSSEERYPVLYVLGGEHRFHYTSGVADFLAADGRIPPLLVVAIPQTNRIRDLTTPSMSELDRKRFPSQGGADTFRRFLSDEVIPFVDGRYRTRPYRILVGHSAGGLFAIHSLTSGPDLFDAHIAISPSLHWSDQDMVSQAEAFFKQDRELRGELFLTIGNEGAQLDGVRKLVAILDENAPKDFRWQFRHLETESHGSISLRGTYLGLETVFRGWHLADPMEMFDQGGLDALDKYFLEGGERFGYKRATPKQLLVNLGFTLINEKRLEEAAAVMLRDPESPPPSVVLHMLAVEFTESGDNERSKELYLLALEQDPADETARSQLEEMGVEVDR